VFDVPAIVAGWRVRRLKPRGAPELVYGRDGCPLVVPIETDMAALRDAVGGVIAKYRLDPVGDNGKVTEDVPAAYVQVVKLEPPSPEVASAAPDDRYAVLKEAMRLNTEIARAMVERFPEMLRASAELLRAADGAGLPARDGCVVDDVDDEPRTSAGSGLAAMLTPILQMFASGLTNAASTDDSPAVSDAPAEGAN
jgi:hypothetical protein